MRGQALLPVDVDQVERSEIFSFLPNGRSWRSLLQVNELK